MAEALKYAVMRMTKYIQSPQLTGNFRAWKYEGQVRKGMDVKREAPFSGEQRSDEG